VKQGKARKTQHLQTVLDKKLAKVQHID